MGLKQKIEEIDNQIADLKETRSNLIEDLGKELSPFKNGQKIKHKDTGEMLYYNSVNTMWKYDSIFNFNAHKIKKDGTKYSSSQVFYDIKDFQIVE
ncbi:MAG: hypothetical protein GY870_09180 [archaeon]|nr:hypothetical protein [archaeon]